MKSIRDSVFYEEVLKEINAEYGDFFLFENFVVSEIFEGVNFTWKEAKPIIALVTEFYSTNGSDLVYISNRINNYSVRPTDWFHFAAYSFSMKGYGVVSYSGSGIINSKLESLFIKSKFKSFTNLMDALQWATVLVDSMKVK